MALHNLPEFRRRRAASAGRGGLRQFQRKDKVEVDFLSEDEFVPKTETIWVVRRGRRRQIISWEGITPPAENLGRERMHPARLYIYLLTRDGKARLSSKLGYVGTRTGDNFRIADCLLSRNDARDSRDIKPETTTKPTRCDCSRVSPSEGKFAIICPRRCGYERYTACLPPHESLPTQNTPHTQSTRKKDKNANTTTTDTQRTRSGRGSDAPST